MNYAYYPLTYVHQSVLEDVVIEDMSNEKVHLDCKNVEFLSRN